MKKGDKIMKIVDWENNVSKKFLISGSSNMDDLYQTISASKLFDDEARKFIDEFYAMYVFNSNQDVVIVTSSLDGKKFSNINYYRQGESKLEKLNGDFVSLIDASCDFVKSTYPLELTNIKAWEKYYLSNFVSEKLNINEADVDIMEDIVNSVTKPNIETLTEGYVDDSSFHSFYTISKNDVNPQVLVILSSKDGKHISNHFSLKIDKNLSLDDYTRILENLNLPSQVSEF